MNGFRNSFLSPGAVFSGFPWEYRQYEYVSVFVEINASSFLFMFSKRLDFFFFFMLGLMRFMFGFTAAQT